MMPNTRATERRLGLSGSVLGRLANQGPVPGGVFSFYLDLADGEAACHAWLGDRLGHDLSEAEASDRPLLAAAYETARAAVASAGPAGEGAIALFVAPDLPEPLLGAVAPPRPPTSRVYRLRHPQLAPLLPVLHDPGRFRMLCLYAGAWSLFDVDGECSRPIVSVKPRARRMGRFGLIPVQIVRRAAAGLDGRRLVVAGSAGEREAVLASLPRRLAMRVASYVGMPASASLADMLAAAREELQTRHQLHVTLETHRVATLALGRRAVTGLDGVASALASARAGRLVVARDFIELMTASERCADAGDSGTSDAERFGEAIAFALRQRVPVTVAGLGVLDHLGGIACTLEPPRERRVRRVSVQPARLGLVA